MMRTKLMALAAAAALALPMTANAFGLRRGCSNCGGATVAPAAPAAPATAGKPATPSTAAPAPAAGPVAGGAATGGIVNGHCGGGKFGGKFGGLGFGGFDPNKWAGKWDKFHNEPPAPSGKNGHGLFQPPFQAAPWYLYWPYDAHFQLPAPIGAPYTPPQNLSTPWNPYFAHPAIGLAGGPPPYPGYPGFGGYAPAPGAGAQPPQTLIPRQIGN